MNIKLNKPFGSNIAVDEFDVRQVKHALNRLGYYASYEKVGMTGIPDTEVFSALKSFQKDQGLSPTGQARPDDDTVEALNREASKNPEGQYIWRTVGDDRVRDTHASFEGEVRAWQDSPDPTEEINCRCWAVPVPKKKPEKKKSKCFEAPTWLEDALANIKKHEGVVFHPYLDTKGLVTIGIGFNVDNENTFMSLKLFVIGANELFLRNATDADKEEGYQKLKDFYKQNREETEDPETGKKKYSINFSAESYANVTNLRIEEGEVNQMVIKMMDEFTAELRKKFPEFDCFPAPARVALMDLIWHVGGTKFNEKKNNWPNLFKAVWDRNWAAAARQSSRTDVEDDRNTDTFNQFMDADAIERQGQTHP